MGGGRLDALVDWRSRWCTVRGEVGLKGYIDLHCHWVAGIDDGARTKRYTDQNSCPPGTDIWVPRTKKILDAVHEHYGSVARSVRATPIYEPG